MALQNIRSNTASKRPLASGLSDGQIAVNTNETSPGLFFKGADDAVLKVGPVHIGNSAPNSSPAPGGSTGNSVGEQWLDTSNSGFVFKIWDGTAWRSETGEFVDVTGDTMTGDLTISGADLVMNNGEIIAASGAEATPSITFDGDLDTGFYKPAADKLGISTGGTSRVVIDDSGLVGIGTTDPDYKLQVSNNNNTSISVKATADDAGPRATRLIYSFDDGDGASINASRATSDTAADVNLSFRTGGITNSEEKMRITPEGLVGIGTTSPNALLEVRNTANSEIRISDTAGGYGNLVYNESGTVSVFEISADPANTSTPNTELRFSVDGSRVITCLNSGNVGIGTSNPGTKLAVFDSTSTNASTFLSPLSLQNNGTNTNNGHKLGEGPAISFRLIRSADGVAAYSAFIRAVAEGDLGSSWPTSLSFGCRRFGNDPVEVMRIDSAGRVGILTTSPQSALDINAAASTSPFIASINSSEAARIDSSGRLLVGTSTSENVAGNFGATSGANIQVVAGSTFAAYSAISKKNDASGPILALASSRSNSIVQQNDRLGEIRFAGYDGTDYQSNAASIKAEVDGTPGANDMPGRLVFSTTADGASGPTERVRIDNAGQTFFTAVNNVLSLSTAAAAGTSIPLIAGRHSGTAGVPGSGTLSFVVWSNGNVVNTNNSYGSLSDIKLKENIVDANSQWDDLKALQVRNYNLKEGQTHTQIGLVAQEVELVSPGLVSETPDRDDEGNDLGTVTKSVNYSVLYMKAVKALQEAMERIETLEQRLTDAGIA